MYTHTFRADKQTMTFILFGYIDIYFTHVGLNKKIKGNPICFILFEIRVRYKINAVEFCKLVLIYDVCILNRFCVANVVDSVRDYVVIV